MHSKLWTILKIKQRIIKMAGLNYDEEILLIGKGDYCCSLFNVTYSGHLATFNNEESEVEYKTEMANGCAVHYH